MSDIIPQVPQKPQYRPCGKPWPKGQSGNPAGRRRGSRNKATLMAALYLDGESEGLVRKAVEMAYAGDPLALRLCLERTIAPRRDRPEPFRLPRVETAADLAPAMAAIMAAAARGVITTGQAAEMASVIATRLRALEADEFNQRLLTVEHGDPTH
jgi:Family of unknown function (DUF5681)